eukprot:Trichotokara_eunicae@DN157_c0_g1_i2.p1
MTDRDRLGDKKNEEENEEENQNKAAASHLEGSRRSAKASRRLGSLLDFDSLSFPSHLKILTNALTRSVLQKVDSTAEAKNNKSFKINFLTNELTKKFMEKMVGRKETVKVLKTEKLRSDIRVSFIPKNSKAANDLETEAKKKLKTEKKKKKKKKKSTLR